MAGRASELKETTIAVALFQRAADYDTKRDPIVRVQAMRVREKLLDYYGSVGSFDPIRIELPKGGYIPEISQTPEPTLIPAMAIGELTLEAEKTNAGEFSKQPSILEEESIGSTKVMTPIRRLSHVVWVALGIAVLCLAGMYLLGRRRGEGASFSAGLVPVDGTPSLVREPAWSADGNFLAYAASEKVGGPTHIYIQDVRHRKPAQRLTREELEESRPVWSPDGREVAFARLVDISRFEIVRMSVERRDIHPITQVQLFTHVADYRPVLDWSPDGDWLLTCEQTAELAPSRLVLISLKSGDMRLLTSPPSLSSGDLDAKFSPDGRTIAFQRGGLGDLYTIRLKGEGAAEEKQLTFDNPGVRGIAWADGGRTILFGSLKDHSPAYRIWKISAEGGELRPVTPEGFDGSMPAFSATQGLVLLHAQNITEMVEHTITGESSLRTFLPSGIGDLWPRYSPDGNSVAFVSSRSGTQELWLMSRSDSEPRQLTHFNGSGRVIWASWSPDGQSLVFPFRQDGATMLYTYSIRTGALRQLTHAVHRHFSPVYSGDGRYIYFSSNDDGTPRIWRIRSDGSAAPEPMFWEGLMQFALSSDNKWLYSVTGQSDGVEILRRDIERGQTQQIAKLPGELASFNDLTVYGDTLFLAVRDNASTMADLEMVNLGSKKVTKVTHVELSSWPDQTTFSIAPSRQTIIVAHPQMGRVLLYHWNPPTPISP